MSVERSGTTQTASDDAQPIGIVAPRTRSGAVAWSRLPEPAGEVELTLAATPAVVAALGTALPIETYARSSGRTQNLDSIYYDTPEGALRARHAALRLRRAGRRTLQTLKTGDPGDPVRRGEWEVALPAPALDMAAFRSVQAQDVLGRIPASALRPVLATRVKRRLRVLQIPDDPAAGEGAAVVEVAFDDGVIEAGGETRPIAEIELELKRGDPAALYRLARRLLAIAPLTVETQSKAARGWLLVDRTPPTWSKARKTAVPPDADVATTFGIILRDCVRHWVANQAAAADGRDPEGVHQMRVALRRLRSALQVFAEVQAPNRRAILDREVKWLADELGDARDWDVFDEELLTPVRDGLGDRALHHLGARVRQARTEGQERARRAIGSPQAAALLVDLWHWIDTQGWQREADPEQRSTLTQPIVAFADRLLDRAHTRVRKAGRGFRNLPVEARHRVRIRMKRLRYLSEFFAELYPTKDTRSYLRAMADLQTALGHLNDVAVAQARLESLADGDPEITRAAGLVLGWHGRAVVERDAELVSRWRRFRARTPFWHSRR